MDCSKEFSGYTSHTSILIETEAKIAKTNKVFRDTSIRLTFFSPSYIFIVGSDSPFLQQVLIEIQKKNSSYA